MAFENFFDETDKHDFRFGMIVIAVIVSAILAVYSYNYLIGSVNDALKPPVVSTEDSRRFTRAAEICDALPKPELFERVNTGREPQFTDSSAEIFQAYRSERDFEEVIPTFLIWFESNGWKRMPENELKRSSDNLPSNRQIIFRKDRNTVNIVYYRRNRYADIQPADYEISCRDGEMSFDIYD